VNYEREQCISPVLHTHLSTDTSKPTNLGPHRCNCHADRVDRHHRFAVPRNRSAQPFHLLIGERIERISAITDRLHLDRDQARIAQIDDVDLITIDEHVPANDTNSVPLEEGDSDSLSELSQRVRCEPTHPSTVRIVSDSFASRQLAASQLYSASAADGPDDDEGLTDHVVSGNRAKEA
jgi:hypothetical protein